jgi:hypothetical protein
MTFTTTPEVERYLAAVRDELGDLPEGEREDLLRDVEASLAEAAEDGEGPLETRLGPASAFAAELRASAGLPPAPVGAPLRPPTLRERVVDLGRTNEARAVARIARELAPVWWIVRGYVLVYVVARLFDASWSTSYPAVPRLDTGVRGLAVILVACLGSVAWGLYWRRRGETWWPPAIALSLVLLALTPWALGHLAASMKPDHIALPVPVAAPATAPRVTPPPRIEGTGIVSVRLTPRRDPRTVTVVVKNTGQDPVYPLGVSIRVDGRTSTTKDSGQLDPGRTRLVTFPIALSPRRRPHVIRVDVPPQPGERNISNNTVTRRVTIRPSR